MKYMIVYSSATGNTEIIASAIKEALKNCACTYFGKPDGAPIQNAELIFVGFWVSRGSCTEEIKKYLGTLENQKIFLFGTAGFGGSESYFESIITDVKQYISPSNMVVDSFMCQGKMSPNVLQRYQKMLEEHPENKNTQEMIDNYNQALPHPDMHDVLAAQARVKSILDGI